MKALILISIFNLGELVPPVEPTPDTSTCDNCQKEYPLPEPGDKEGITIEPAIVPFEELFQTVTD